LPDSREKCIGRVEGGSIDLLLIVNSALNPASPEKPHPYWFLIYGFNFAILAGLFAALFGRWKLGTCRGLPGVTRLNRPRMEK
jgi:uncharacterized protein involved in exopolysaccharide biosynthesis